jgi:hypothetical protein
MGVVLQPIHHWVCPNCHGTDVTHEARPHSRFHNCPKFGGLSMPMVQAGTRAKVELREREDYVGNELVQLHEGRPIMSIVTIRDDGQDCAVFAPTATVSVRT